MTRGDDSFALIIHNAVEDFSWTVLDAAAGMRSTGAVPHCVSAAHLLPSGQLSPLAFFCCFCFFPYFFFSLLFYSVQQPAPAQLVSAPNPLLLPSPIQPVFIPQTPTQSPFSSTQYLPPVSALAATTTSPPPKVDLISIEPIPIIQQSLAPIRQNSTTPPPVVISTQAPTRPPQQQIAAASTISAGSAILPGMNMALMPQVPTMQMAQIASLNVDCAKESMLVKIKFDRPFGGLIYSKVFENTKSIWKIVGSNLNYFPLIGTPQQFGLPSRPLQHQ